MYIMEEKRRLELWAQMDDPNFTGGTQEHWDSLACTRDESPFAVGDKVTRKLRGLLLDRNFPQTIAGLRECPGYTYAGELFIYTMENPNGFYAAGLKIIIPALAAEKEIFANLVIGQALSSKILTEKELMEKISI